MIEEPTEVGYYAVVSRLRPSNIERRKLFYFNSMGWIQLFTTAPPVYLSWSEVSKNLRSIKKVPDELWKY